MSVVEFAVVWSYTAPDYSGFSSGRSQDRTGESELDTALHSRQVAFSPGGRAGKRKPQGPLLPCCCLGLVRLQGSGKWQV